MHIRSLMLGTTSWPNTCENVRPMISATQIFLNKAALRLLPNLYRRKAIRWAKDHIADNAVFFLSFDCDTSRDASASLKIQRQLHSAGMNAAYAIPGQLLEKHWDSYKELISLGGYFINHGYREHAAIDPISGRPYSTFTYRDVEDHVWQQDIIDGHNTIKALTGKAPTIFRTPHFGEFDKPEQLERLYDFLTTLNYQISTSSTPILGHILGPIHRQKHSIIEIPLSGCLTRPAQLIDSWGFISAPDALGRQSLIDALKDYLSTLSLGSNLVMNIYFDPADISEDQEILDLLVKFKPYCLPGYNVSFPYQVN